MKRSSDRASIVIMRIAALFALWICSGAALAAEARAWLDRASMHVGETVTLNVEISGDSGANQPDFSVLQNDFDLLGTQSSSSMSVINGQASSKLLWAVGLQPRRAGTFTIPALNVGSAKTEPLRLSVLPPAAGAVGKAGDDLFVTVDAAPRAPYVQQEVRLTVKLYYALSLIDGTLEEPKAPGLVVRKLGADSNYTADVEGRRYRVVERHYALAPETSGTLDLAPIVFRGRALDSGDMNSFFSRGRAVTAQSEPVAFDVTPKPAAAGSDMWLPAQSLTLTADGIDPAKPLRVGEPLTLTLHLKAQGLGYEQLPELKLAPIDGAAIYPDKETTQNRDDGAWIYGSRERKFAIVPSRAGTLALPALAIGWWDTEHDRAATAEIAAQTITVEPAPGAAAPEPASPAASEPAPAPKPAAQPAPAAATGERGADATFWRAVALAAIALWLVSLALVAAWAWRRRRSAAHAGTGAAPARIAAGIGELRAACARGDLGAAGRALLRRAQRERPALRNLGELARAVDDASQRAAIVDLERALYAGGERSGVGERLVAAFRDGPRFAAAVHAHAAAPLPPLYPFEVTREDARD